MHSFNDLKHYSIHKGSSFMSLRSTRWSFVGENYFYTLFWVLSVLFVFSFQHAFLLMITIGGLLLVTLYLIWKRPPRLSSLWEQAFVFGGVLLAVSTLTALSPGRSLEWMMLNAFPALLFWLAWKERTLPPSMLLFPHLIVVSIYIVLGLASVFQSFMPWVMMRVWPFQPFRAVPFFLSLHPNLFAHLLAVSYPTLMAFTVASSGGGRYFMRIWLVLAGFLLVLTNSRGALLALGVGMVVFFLLAGSQRSTFLSTLFRPYWLWGIFLFSSISIFAWQLSLRACGMVPRIFLESGRLYLWRWGFQAWLQRPLWGYGPGAWALIHLQSIPIPGPGTFFADMPHNLLVDILVSTGLLGWVWLLITTVLFLREVFRHRKRWGIWQWAAASSGIIWLAHHFVDESVHLGGWNLVPMTLLLVLFPKGSHDTQTTTRSFYHFLWRLFALICFLFVVGHSVALGYYQRGWSQAQQGNWGEAATWIERAARWAPWKPAYLAAAAFAYANSALQADPIDRELLQRSSQLYTQALRQEPQYAVHWANYAWVLWLLDRPQEAKQSMAQAVRQAPYSPFLYALGWMEEQEGNEKEALVFYQEFLTYYPKFSLSSDFQGGSWMRQKALSLWRAKREPEFWFSWTETLYRALLWKDLALLNQVLEMLSEQGPCPYGVHYVQTLYQALQGDPVKRRLFFLLALPGEWEWELDDVHFKVLVELAEPEKALQLSDLTFMLENPSSQGYGQAMGRAWNYSSVLYRITPLPGSDLLPTFPYPRSPAWEALQKVQR